jgi:5-formyltetrahydrofolate cyclo-ligase
MIERRNTTPGTTGPQPEPFQVEPGPAGDLLRAKAALRAIVRAQLKGITAEQRAGASVQACQRLAEQEVWRKAAALLCYAPRPDELDISPLIENALESGKIVALPQFDPQTKAYRVCQITVPIPKVAVGTFGIREPGRHCASLPLNQLDLILVPGLAFDLAGHRLGRGRGFYDLLLTGIRGVKCGLAFDEQVRPHIPVARHDVLLDCILTPTRWVDMGPRRFGDDLVG